MPESAGNVCNASLQEECDDWESSDQESNGTGVLTAGLQACIKCAIAVEKYGYDRSAMGKWSGVFRSEGLFAHPAELSTWPANHASSYKFERT